MRWMAYHVIEHDKVVKLVTILRPEAQQIALNRGGSFIEQPLDHVDVEGFVDEAIGDHLLPEACGASMSGTCDLCSASAVATTVVTARYIASEGEDQRELCNVCERMFKASGYTAFMPFWRHCAMIARDA